MDIMVIISAIKVFFKAEAKSQESHFYLLFGTQQRFVSQKGTYL